MGICPSDLCLGPCLNKTHHLPSHQPRRHPPKSHRRVMRGARVSGYITRSANSLPSPLHQPSILILKRVVIYAMAWQSLFLQKPGLRKTIYHQTWKIVRRTSRKPVHRMAFPSGSHLAALQAQSMETPCGPLLLLASNMTTHLIVMLTPR